MATLPTQPKLAVLIDADNAQAVVVQALLSEVSRYGTATIKRAYGDWTVPHLRGWREPLHRLAIQAVQQFSYTLGKNSTDAALIIDAMDILHAGTVDGFCLVSSDSDFTRLATRIREAGLVVYGFGERKTPQAFVAACDKFIYTEILRPEFQAQRELRDPRELRDLRDLREPPVRAEEGEPEELSAMVLEAVDALAREDGWAMLGPVGNFISKNHPSFDPRNYGVIKLGELMRRQDYLEMKEVPMGDGSTNVHLHVRRRVSRTEA